MTKKMILLNNLAQLFRTIFYPKFIPKCNVSGFTIPGWKISVFNAGPLPGKEIVIRCLATNKEKSLSMKDLCNEFLTEVGYIKFAKQHGFSFDGSINNILHFSLLT